MNRRAGPVVVESYRGYSPSLDVRAVTESLLGDVPARFIAGLHEVLLTNSGGLSHGRRRARAWHRGRKLRAAEARGLYHRAWQGRPASIEIFVDNTLRDAPGWLLRLPPVRARLRRRYPWLYFPLSLSRRLVQSLAAAVRWVGRRLGAALRRT